MHYVKIGILVGFGVLIAPMLISAAFALVTLLVRYTLGARRPDPIVLMIIGIVVFLAVALRSGPVRRQRSFRIDTATGSIIQSGNARASWTQVYASPRGDTVSIDTGTFFFQPGGKAFTVWAAFVFPDTGMLTETTGGGKFLVHTARVHEQIDCAHHRQRMLRLLQYDWKGHLALSERYDPNSTEWDQPDTASIGGALRLKACELAPPSPAE